MFRVSKRLDYALQFLVSLGISENPKSYPTAQLSDKLNIPLPFLHQIGHTLMQAGLVKASPGPKGGVKLAGEPENISVNDVLEVLEGPIDLVSHNNKTKNRNATSLINPTQYFWNDLEQVIVSNLKSIKLAELIKNAKTDPAFSRLFE